MATSKLVQWQGGSRATASGSTSFLLKQSREPYGSIPKTNYAFQLWIIENGYLERLANNAIDSTILYQQLHDQFFGKCGGGDGTLLFGVQVVRKNRTLLPKASDVRIRATWGYPKLRGTKDVEETIFVEVNNTDSVTVSDYYVNQNSPERIGWNTSGRVGGTIYSSAYKWTEGGAFDSDGDRLTSLEALTVEREIDATGTMKLSFPGKRIGTLQVFINHQFDDYVLTLPTRDLGTGPDIFDEQKVYDSNVLGFGAGDYVNMPIEIPDSAADCIPYAQIIDPETGQYITVIEGSETHLGYDSDGDGFLDGGAEVDDCECWMCGGTGDLPDCEESAVVDCTCPNCQGTGILPACQEDEDSETNTSYYYYYNNKGEDDADDDTDKPYTLTVDEHICTGEITDWHISKN